MMAAGAALGIGGSLLKKKPKIPTYKPVNQQASQESAIAANLASFPRARELADMTSQADQERLDSVLASIYPQYRETALSAGGAIQDMIAGRLPFQDQQMTIRRAGERSMLGGYANTQAGRNLTTRDLGRFQYDMTQAGLNAFNQLSSNVRRNFTVNPMSTAFSYMSVPQYIQNEIGENRFGYQALVGKRQSDAANSWQSRLGGGLESLGGTMFGYGLSAPSGGGGFGSTGGGQGYGYSGPAITSNQAEVGYGFDFNSF